MIKVCKRSGVTVDFNENKIYAAISAAYTEVYKNIENKESEINLIVDNVIDTLNNFSDTIHVETIQDVIEKEIAEHDFNVAKAYVLYRYQRKVARNDYDFLINTMAETLGATNVQNQNANVDEKSFGGRLGSMASAMSKYYALNYIMSPLAKTKHENNEIYTHDLDHYALGDHNCLTMPFDKLLAEGFNTRQTDIRPAKSVSSAFQLIAVLFQLQSLNQFGGVSASHIDHTLVPYVRMSLFKHYILEYVKTCEGLLDMDLVSMSSEEIDDWIDKNKERYLKLFNLSQDDFYIGSNKLEKNLYQRALLETIKEIYQAVEGMYHNLKIIRAT